MGFVHDLVLSYESDGESSDTSDIDDHDHGDHALYFFTPYEDQDSTSEEEMEVVHPLYDNAPLSDFAKLVGRQLCILLSQTIFLTL